MDKQTAKANLKTLVAKFRSEFESGKTDNYNEESTKKSFIEPLLEDVLGWDVANRDEVTMEERVSRDRVDYGIKLKDKVVFFVEAKPVKADLDKAIPQAVKYCFNRKDVPFVMLTDFEGLMFFDATFKPDLRHPKKGMKIDLNWKDYEEKFDELWQLSKLAVEEGSLEKLFTLKPKDRVQVDKAILNDLEDWREHLAKNLYKNNLDLFHSDSRDKDSHFLKEVTQKLLDRIIFIRFCEDRQLTMIRQLAPRFDERGENTGLNTMYILSGAFKEYEAIFNSDLFAVKDWEKDLKLDFTVMNKIIHETYDPYMFDAMPLEVLGNIYEQYLGYTIKLAGDSIKYELKPEVRKAGGVYYTPEYIVDYIVKNTVGKLLEELPEAKAKKLRILDPACGSGSFLIRAYDEMMKYYLGLKKKSKIKIAEGQTAMETGESGTRLSIEEKARILKEHIYGVDIDDQAVEVTKLSLMLKMLDGEWGFVKGTAVLPMLDKNIRCGNSLISGNVLELNKYFGDEYYKVKPFNWEEKFKEIMVGADGFDIVIGNPPYGSIMEKEEKDYIENTYKYQNYQLDSYLLFVERSLIKLLKVNGFYGMIIPNPWLTNLLQKNMRKFIFEQSSIKKIVHFKYPVFSEAVVDAEILIYQKSKPNKNCVEVIVVEDKTNNILIENNNKLIHKQEKWIELNGNTVNIFLNPEEEALANKCKENTIPLSELCKINVGIKPYQVGKGNPPQKKHDVEMRIFDSEKKKNSLFRQYLRGSDINKFRIEPIKSRYIKYGKWLAEPRPAADFDAPQKILMRQTGDSLIAAYDNNQYLCLNNMHVLVPNNENIQIFFLLGIINSSLLNWYYQSLNPEKGEALAEVKKSNVERLPIRTMNLKIKKDVEFQDNIIKLVKIIIDLYKKLNKIKGSSADHVQSQISQTNKEIDNLVYYLYDIKNDEIKIIEGKI